MKKQILIGALVLLATILVVFANPIMDAITDKNVFEGQTLEFNVTATAPDNGTTTFTVTGATWATITKISDISAKIKLSPANGLITRGDTATYTINAVATDGNSTDTKSFTTTVEKRLKVNDLKVYVDDKKVSGISEDEAANVMDIDDVYVSSKLKVEIELKNLFDDKEDIAIEDIEIEGVLEEIDDGDDLEETAEVSDLDAEEKDTAELLFDIPETAEDDTYNLVVTITGDNEDTNEEYEITLEFNVNVEKKSHDLRIDRAELTPAAVSCDRTSELYLKIRNFGKNDEDEIRVTVENTALGIKFEEKDISLDSDIDEYWTKTIPIDAKNLAAGDYKLSTKVYYDVDKLFDIKDVLLTVQKCVVAAEEQPAAEPEVVVVTPPAAPAAATGTTTGSDITETFEGAGFFESTNMVPILLIVGIVAVIILIVLMLVLVFRR